MYPFFTNKNYQEGVEQGFRIAEDHFIKWLDELNRELKTHILEIRATSTTTLTPHKCNCEFCRVDKKKLKI